MEHDIQPYQLYGFWHSWWFQQRFFLIKAMSIGVMVVISLFLIFLFMRKKKKQIVPAWDQTLLDLELAQHTYEGKKSYDSLVHTVRSYLILRYDIAWIGLSDEELLAYFKERSDWSDQMVELWQALITLSQKPRFSQHQEYAAWQELQKVSRTLVKSTIPS